jgi:protein arginine N-methyltransferase 7
VEAEPEIFRVAKEVLKLNEMNDKVKLINKHSTELRVGSNEDLEDKVDILLFEVLDSFLLGEDVLKTLQDAQRRLLKPNYIVIPQRSTIIIQLIGSFDISLTFTSRTHTTLNTHTHTH